MDASGDPQIYKDNVFVLPVGDDLVADLPLHLFEPVERFYEQFEDAFDFLIILPNVYLFEIIGSGDVPYFSPARNDVEGIGLETFSRSGDTAGAGILQGIVYLHYNGALLDRTILLHELMHRWGATITGSDGAHWHFSSANGMLGGFDIEDLVDLGNGQYAIASSWKGGGTFVHPDRYSPIELYLAGLMPAEEVPDLWVAEDVEWVRDESGNVALTEEGYQIFQPGRVRIYTIEEIIAEHGKRVPDVSLSQKRFKAAVILLIDEGHPAIRWQLDKLSADVAEFGFPGTTDDGKSNFYEATRGRATMSLDDLSDHWKGP